MAIVYSNIVIKIANIKYCNIDNANITKNIIEPILISQQSHIL